MILLFEPCKEVVRNTATYYVQQLTLSDYNNMKSLVPELCLLECRKIKSINYIWNEALD